MILWLAGWLAVEVEWLEARDWGRCFLLLLFILMSVSARFA